jgi:hypothetical protein
MGTPTTCPASGLPEMVVNQAADSGESSADFGRSPSAGVEVEDPPVGNPPHYSGARHSGAKTPVHAMGSLI